MWPDDDDDDDDFSLPTGGEACSQFDPSQLPDSSIAPTGLDLLLADTSLDIPGPSKPDLSSTWNDTFDACVGSLADHPTADPLLNYTGSGDTSVAFSLGLNLNLGFESYTTPTLGVVWDGHDVSLEFCVPTTQVNPAYGYGIEVGSLQVTAQGSGGDVSAENLSASLRVSVGGWEASLVGPTGSVGASTDLGSADVSVSGGLAFGLGAGVGLSTFSCTTFDLSRFLSFRADP